ncbi:MAG TPA: hypothetical protein VNN72_02825 [Polyangiaceae bacterium]|nr:hypothetical protein [Polyangiaceae bacterium]
MAGKLPGIHHARGRRLHERFGVSFRRASPAVHAVESAPVTNGVLKATLPALSATIFVCDKG